MTKVYERTENGVTSIISQREGLAEINKAMMEGEREVREMSSITRTDYAIEYKDGRSVRLVLIDPPAPAEEADEFSNHVVSVRGGKVHKAMPGVPEGHAYPLCRGGGMNQMLTQFVTTTAPLSCKTCQTYEERRAAHSKHI
ncbi:hypothetical protein ACF1DV_26075 [Streptomyces achromogenes]|uniref:hypothetical protein n=1 Tax=Streptomyces achromogenes TaxID=67255 RepID=UPI0036FD06BC